MTLPNSPSISKNVDAALAALDLKEKVDMLSGHGFFESYQATSRYCAEPYAVAGGNDRLGLPVARFVDGPRGIVTGASTCFPVPMARGASFDVDLEHRIGDAIGREARAHGANLFGGVCINLLRHPAWGRAQETYGEDPHLLGVFGAALIQGVQHHNVIATIKHFAANSMENARFKVDVKMSERVLHEVYLPHFKAGVDAGCGAVMSAYNQLNGDYCGHSKHLLTDILKERWGFEGFVYSDFISGCHSAEACARGLDVEAPDTIYFGEKLVAAVEAGDVLEERIDDAVSRVLTTLHRFIDAEDPETYSPAVIASTDHINLAQEAEEKSVVLLKNDQDTLPFSLAETRSIAVIGPWADQANLGDRGSSNVHPPFAESVAQGLEKFSGGQCAIHTHDGQDIASATRLAKECDTVVLVVGYDHRDEGEYIPGGDNAAEGSDKSFALGGDRSTLSLPSRQIALIKEVCAANRNHVVTVISGSAVVMNEWVDEAGAVMMIWYPGMKGGSAIANLVFGEVSPSGKLPFAIPASEEDLVFFDRDADEIEYGLLHGYSWLHSRSTAAQFEFGHGMSYATFSLSNIRADVGHDTVCVQCEVTNLGDKAGAEVVQVYVGKADSGSQRAPRLLKGFNKIDLSPGETRATRIDLPRNSFAIYDEVTHDWKIEAGKHEVHVGTSASEDDLTTLTIML